MCNRRQLILSFINWHS